MNIFMKLSHFRFVVLLTSRYYSKNHPFKHSNLNLLLLEMPKKPTHIADAQKQRLKIKQKSANYSPGRVSLQVLGTGAKGAPRSVYLFSDQSRYLFNCGEGTQRLAHEHKTKLAKLEHIFITEPTWQNIGGLPGTALTIQDVGVPQITLHGPDRLNEIFPATKRFVVIRDLKINMANCSESDYFEDNVLSVKYVHLHKTGSKSEVDKDVQVSAEQTDAATSTRSEKKRRSSSTSSRNGEYFVEDDTDYYAHEHSGKRTAPESISSVTQSLAKNCKTESISMCYICRLQPRPGALNLDKCVQNGVPPGPLLGKLKNGEDITLKNGTIVKSVDVCEPDDPGPVFLVVDCPSPEYLESLISNPMLKKHQKFAQSYEDAACLVVHFTPQEIMELPMYKQWIGDFTLSTQHIPVNESNSCMGSVAVHRIQHKLNMLSSDFFPLLGDQGTPALSQTSSGSHQNKKQKSDDMNFAGLKLDMESSSDCKNVDKTRHIGCLTSYHLRPKKGVDITSHIKLDPQEFVEESMCLAEFPDALKELQQKLQVAKSNSAIRDYPKILFLGTGSCIPNKTRNTSGILLEISNTKNILLDCGEGTCGQIYRFFGLEKANRVLTDIDAIYISHLHADHHIGLIGLLQGRRKALDLLRIKKEPLILFAPKQILAWLSFYDRNFENIQDEFILVPNGDLILNQTTYPDDMKMELLNNLDLCDISTCLVRHCPNAFGVTILHKSGYKITYSGDTMPSDNLVELGKNSDILIHEATMEDELDREAVVKMHSTTSQAIQVGKDMKAKHVILTHFSQRYAKLPRFNDNFDDNVSIAFDNMQVRLDELHLIPLLYPALKIMFAEHYEQLEHKAVKRQQKAEREAFLERTKLPQNSS